MVTRASYFKIGLFTLAATALLVAVIIALGAGALLHDRVIVETYLDETVQGIEVGSPVKYRGVQVGNVDDIMFTYNVYERQKPLGERRGYVLVRMAVSPKFVERATPEGFGRMLKELVARGLRVRLRPQGVTGLSYLEMDYISDPELYPDLEFEWTPAHFYVPSAPGIGSRIEDAVFSITRTLRTLEEADLGTIAGDIQKLVVSVTDLVRDPEVAALRDEATRLIVEARETTRMAREFLEKPEVRTLLEDTSGAAAAVKRIAETSERDLPPMLEDLRRTAEGLRTVSDELPETMRQLNATLRRLSLLLADQQRRIAATLENVESASANLRELTDEARRYPAHVLFGEPPPPVEVPER